MNYRLLAHDLGSIGGLMAVSLAAGLGLNALRSSPLSLTYHSPAERLDSALTQLVSSPNPLPVEIPTIDLATFQRIQATRQALILDARSASFYQQGHVPNALNLSREDFATDYRRLSGILDKDKPIVVYCSGGDCHDSKLVAGALFTLGYSDVRVFSGGWEAWTEAGLPVSG